MESVNKWKAVSTHDLKARLKSELAQESPDRNMINDIMAELEARSPVGEIPIGVVIQWEESRAEKKRKAKKVSSVWKKTIAAVLAVVLVGMIPSVMGAENIFERIGRWTKDVFSFTKPINHESTFQTDHPGLQELYNIVTGLGVTQKVVPSWLPDGYETDLITQKSTPRGITVLGVFASGNSKIQIRVDICNESIDMVYQKTDDQIEVREHNGATIYIFTNEESCCATWRIENIECAIYVDTKELLYKMIESI